MFKHLVIIGAGGHGQAIADLALSLRKFSKISFLDDSYPKNNAVLGIPVIGNSSYLFNEELDFDSCFVAIGNNAIRKLMVCKIIENDFPLVSLVHPRAWASEFAEISRGCAVMAGAVVGTSAKLGLASLVNANATVDHDCILHKFSHLGVGVQLAGGVEVGEEAWLQSGCSAGYGVKVTSQSVCAPGQAIEAK